ncbi:MAG: isochorismate synthase [Hyphomicrobiaceae bacterium]|jgi:isochorismate synthase
MNRIAIERRIIARGRDVIAPTDRPGSETWMFWSRPRLRMVGLGQAAVVATESQGRFTEARKAMAGYRVHGAAATDPLWFGGFAFDTKTLAAPWTGWPDLSFVVPRLLWIDDARGPRLVANWIEGDEAPTRELIATWKDAKGRIDSHDDSHDDGVSGYETRPEASAHWMSRVADARDAIRDGRLDKIVLARMKRILPPERTSVGNLAARLADRPGQATTFVVTHGDSEFVGSSPETLVRLTGGKITADALAGSSARGVNPAEDRTRAEQLLVSTKDRHEHELVVDAVRRSLARTGATLTPSNQPKIAAFPEALHLRTPVVAQAAKDTHLLDIAAAVHPSPAVCGTPTRAAREQLLREEQWRGWYAGGVGWIAPNGDGEIVVALRAALLTANAAWCFAGAGIVDDSDPTAELAETEFKFSVIETLLGAGQRAHAA